MDNPKVYFFFLSFFKQNILAEFSKEQEAFIKEKESKANGTAVPPWSGCPNEASLKEQCLALSTVRISAKMKNRINAIIKRLTLSTTPCHNLITVNFRFSQDRKNFVRSPPSGADFKFDYEVSYPIAMATLAEDPNLEKMRFELVPKV